MGRHTTLVGPALTPLALWPPLCKQDHPQSLHLMCKFSFTSVNMRRHNAAMHALLNHNGEEDLLCVQEPWFNPVGTVQCDNMI
jgi:hypothetical protein